VSELVCETECESASDGGGVSFVFGARASERGAVRASERAKSKLESRRKIKAKSCSKKVEKKEI